VGSAEESTITAGRTGARGRLRTGSHAYGLLLALILTSLTFQLAVPDEGWARVVTIVVQSVAVLVALFVSGVHPWLRRLATVLAVVAVLASAGVLISAGGIGHLAGRSVALMVVGLTPIAIVYGIVQETRDAGRVTMQTMFGGLCIYLLLGMLFAFVYGIIGSIAETPFFAEGDAETQANFLYFSFATQTTTGYGDLTAATDVGRSFAITEALIGQIYLVTVVALIVSNLGRPRPAARP